MGSPPTERAAKGWGARVSIFPHPAHPHPSSSPRFFFSSDSRTSERSSARVRPHHHVVALARPFSSSLSDGSNSSRLHVSRSELAGLSFSHYSHKSTSTCMSGVLLSIVHTI